MNLLLLAKEAVTNLFSGLAVSIGRDASQQFGAAEVDCSTATEWRRTSAEDDCLIRAHSGSHLVGPDQLTGLFGQALVDTSVAGGAGQAALCAA